METGNFKRNIQKSYTNSKWYTFSKVFQIIANVFNLVFLIAAGLGEYRIRDLNDEINKLLREKYHWEVQIFNLGGPNYRRIGPRYLDREGREVPGNRGYRYFGAARELPGIRIHILYVNARKLFFFAVFDICNILLIYF